MSKINVPRYFIRHMFQPAGVRLDKFKKPTHWPWITDQERRAREGREFHPPLALPGSVYTPTTGLSGIDASDRPDFDHADYEYFSVIGWTKIDEKPFPIAKCRCCEQMLVTRERRTKHLADKGCAPLLRSAYELILRDSKCIICDERTAHRKWGLPLCIEPVCRKSFMESASQPEVLTNAILIVQLEKGDQVWNLC